MRKAKNTYKAKQKITSLEYLECDKMDMIAGLPMFIVVTPDSYGIYDDYLILKQHTMGMEYYVASKNYLIECKNDIYDFFKYHFPNNNYPPKAIYRKNMLIKLGGK